MIRVLVATILWVCLLPATAHAQPTLANLEAISPVPLGEWDFEGGQLHFPETVFASLPAAGTSGRIYIVTDATTSSDCSAGGGTARALCRDTGASWESIGGGGGGSGNSFVTWDMPVGTDPVADSSTDTITFVCPPPMVCAGNSSTDTLTLSVTTPTPTLSATPTVTVTTTAFACDPGFALDQAHPEACVELPTPDGGANFPTPTVVVTVTPTPIVCATNAAWGLGGLFKAHPEECQAVGPTPTPTATATASPTATLTSAPTATATPFFYAAGDAVAGGATKVTGSATLPATCTEKDLYQDTDSGGTEFYVCTATNTWTKVITGSDVPANETDPTVPLLSLADLGDLCAANEGTVRNGTDTANVCVALVVVTPTPTATATNTNSPKPVSTASPGLAGAVLGTSLTMARADHVHALPDSSVAAGSYTNANITVNSKGLLTSASSGTNIPAGFALYVDKAGTDGVSCGPLNAPCKTIAGAHAIIYTANDNGATTCETGGTQSFTACNRCCTGSAGCLTDRTSACNENADCTGTTATCTAAICETGADQGKPCRSSADCASAATCAVQSYLGMNSNACTSPAGTCSGANKAYAIRIGSGKFNEALDNAVCTGSGAPYACCAGSGTGMCSPPSPGYVYYIGDSQQATQIYSVDTTGFTVNVTSRTVVDFRSLSIAKTGNTKAAVGSTGNATIISAYDVGLQHTGDNYDLDVTGGGNTTWTFTNITAFGAGAAASARSIHLQNYPNTCSTATTRACETATTVHSTDCPGAETCVATASGDFDFQRIFLQPGTQSTDPALWLEGKSCGKRFNEFFRDIYFIPNNPGIVKSGTVTAIKTSETDCDAASICDGVACTHKVLMRLGNIQVDGNLQDTLSPDTTLNVGSNTTVRAEGSLNFDHCKRTISGTLEYAESNTATADRFGGGPTDLGVLTCTAPVNPVNGECWYDRDTDARRECRIGGLTVGMLTSNNATQYNYQSCNLTEAAMCVTADNLSSTPTTILTDSTTWDNTGKTTQIEGQAEVISATARTIICKLKNNASTVHSRSVQVDGSTTTGIITLHYIDTATGTRGPYTLTCETNSGTPKGDVTSATMLRTTTDVPAQASVSSQIAAWLSDETGTGALVFGVSPSITTATLVGDTIVNGRVIIGPTVTPVVTPTAATPTPTSTVTPTPTVTVTAAASPTTTGATATPTPSASPTPGLLVKGVSNSGCTCYTAAGASTTQYALRGGFNATQSIACIAPSVVTAVGKLRCRLDRDVAWGAEFSCQVEKSALASMVATADAGSVSLTWTKQPAPRCYIHGTNAGGEWRCEPGARGANYTDGWTIVNPEECYHIRMDVTVLSNYTIDWCECPLGALQ